MAGRANQMSATDAYAMAPSRWGVMVKTLSNRKALEDAFRQHDWKMQELAAQAASGATQQHIAGQYHLKAQELQNQGIQGLNYKVQQQALAEAKRLGLDLNDPEGFASFQQIYQKLMSQVQMGMNPAMAAATTGDVGGGGTPPNVPESVGTWDPRRMLPGYANYGIPKGGGSSPLDRTTAQKILTKAGGDPAKARAMAAKLGYSF